MRKFTRAICFFLTIVLLVQQVLPVHAKGTGEERTEVETISRTYVNPVYEDIVDIKTYNRPAVKNSTYALSRSAKSGVESVDEDEFLTDKNDVADVIREAMVNREESVTFYYKNKTGYDENDLPKWFELALAETENSDEGDYLRWHYGQVGADISFYEEDETSYFEYVMYFTYYTTKDQEDELTKRIESVLNDLGADNAGLTDYEKTKLIYDYICENVTYDEENLYDDSYMLKYTAYAAMMNRTALCQGYASLIYRMLEECDVDARVVFGTSGGENHTWTLSEIEEKYYLSDSTWDAGKEEYSYFLKGEENFTGHDAQSAFLSEYEVQNEDYDSHVHEYVNGVCKYCGEEKPYTSISFTETKTTKTYTGKAIGIDKSIVEITKGNKDYTLKYYVDKECTVPTYEGDAALEGSAPVAAGDYYVKAFTEETENYRYTETKNPHRLVIVPSKVTSFKVANSGSTVKISWKKRPEATGYLVYRKKSGEDYSQIARIKSNATISYTDKKVSSGTKYAYYIVAYKTAENGTEVKSSKVSAQIVHTRVSVSNQNGSVKVKWSKVANAAGYKVYRKASGDDSYQGLKNIKSGTTTYYTDKTAKTLRNGKAAAYIVIPYYSEDSSVVLKSGSKINVYLARTSISSLKAGSKALTVKWKKNSSATGYQIRYSTSSSMENAKTVTVKSAKTVSKKLSNLKAKKTYYVQVRSYKTYKDINYYSTWSAKKSLKTK